MNLKDLDQLFAHIKTGVLLLNSEQQLLFMNSEAERLVGHSYIKSRTKDIQEILGTSEQLARCLERCLKQGVSFGIREYELLQSKQAKKNIEIEGSPIIADILDDAKIFLILRDNTSLKDLQSQRQNLDRLALMGTLASGLAHEIKNPLSGINAAAEMIQREPSSDELQDYAQMIQQEVRRLDSLIKELLDFSKTEVAVLEPVNVNRVLDEIVSLQKLNWMKAGVQVHFDLDPSLPDVAASRDQLKQAMLNLLNNAFEAMLGRDGEVATINIRSQWVTDYLFKQGEKGYNRMVKISIQDQGEGMSEQQMESLFSPFFTTKPGGTGLGLMITQKIIKECEGSIRFKSEIGQGTLVEVYLNQYKEAS